MRQQGGKTAGKIQFQDKLLCKRGEAEPLMLDGTAAGGRYRAEDKGERSQHAAEENCQSHIWREETRLYRFFNSHISSANSTNHM